VFQTSEQKGVLSVFQVKEQGVDPNLRDGDGATPLHFAASRGHVETVRWLLRHGARLVLDKFGKSPINDAAENQQIEVRTVFAFTEPKPLFALILIYCFFVFSALTSSFNTVPPPTILKLGTNQPDAVAARASRRRR